MIHSLIKKATLGILATILIAGQLSTVALASEEQDIQKAAQAGIQYLAKNQDNDGRISGFGGETEWSAIAVEAMGQNASEFDNGSGVSAVDFLKNNPPDQSTPATEIERKILAIAASGENLAGFGGIDYKARLAGYHNNAQIGDVTLLNDDIFGIIAIDAANDSGLQPMAQDGLNYLLAHQLPDGGFSYTTQVCDYCGSDSNDTAAAIIALYSAENMGLDSSNLIVAKEKAIAYLISTQKQDGGFGYDSFSDSDGSSTSWSLMALNILGASVKTQALSARNWLLANQNEDGGFSYAAYGLSSSSTSITPHAVLALLSTTWLLQPAPSKPSPVNSLSASETVTSSSTNSSSSSTPTSAQASRLLDVTRALVSFIRTSQNGAVSSPVQPPSATENSPVAVQAASSSKPTQDDGENSGATTPRADKSDTNGTPYGLAALLLTALAWFVIQSIKKREVYAA